MVLPSLWQDIINEAEEADGQAVLQQWLANFEDANCLYCGNPGYISSMGEFICPTCDPDTYIMDLIEDDRKAQQMANWTTERPHQRGQYWFLGWVSKDYVHNSAARVYQMTYGFGMARIVDSDDQFYVEDMVGVWYKDPITAPCGPNVHEMLRGDHE